MTTVVLNSVEEGQSLKEEIIRSEKFLFALFKRTADFILAFTMCLLALLILPFVALLIKIESAGPIFFRQRRVGKDEKIFELLKFRSTYRTAVDETVGWSKDEENIYTSIGKFLRKSYLDEIPQVINVLKGEMSFIGPRPERPEFVQILKQAVPFYELRLLVRPGLTGWAQINMENDASAQDGHEKLKYDLYYIKNRSLGLEFKIILRTIWMVMRRQGR